MKYKYWLFFLTLVFIYSILSSAKLVSAHPIDNTDAMFYFTKDANEIEIPATKAEAYFYLNWFQAGAIVEREKNYTAEDIYELVDYQDLYDSYVLNKTALFNNDKECKETLVSMPILTDDFSLSLGTRIIVNYECEEKIGNVKIYNDLVNDYYFSPSNTTSVLNGNGLLHKLTLTKENKEYLFNLNELSNNPIGDDSYDTTANLSAEDVQNSMFNSEVENSKLQYVTAGQEIAEPKQKNFITETYDNIYNQFSNNKDKNIIFLILLALFLGFLHTLEAGHSKAVLASIMLNNKVSIKNGIAYALVFTATHVADIILLGIIFLVADQFFNIFSNFSIIEQIAGYILLVTALIILFRNLRDYRKTGSVPLEFDEHDDGHEHEHSDQHDIDHSHDHGHDHTYNNKKPFREQIMLGFITGLAPCLFGWSIFMLVISMGNIWLLFPIVTAFAVGIFLALTLVVIIVGKIKKGTYKHTNSFAKISPIISALLLVIYALFIVF